MNFSTAGDLRSLYLPRQSQKFSLLLIFFCCAGAYAESATVEVQGIAASDLGKKNPSVPAALAGYKAELLNTNYGTFADAGRQSVKTSSSTKGSAAIGKYSVDIAVTKVEGEPKVVVTINAGGRPIITPIRHRLVSGRRFVLEVGAKDAPTIFIITVKDTN